jgi:predicted amidohydrolase YtcJ
LWVLGEKELSGLNSARSRENAMTASADVEAIVINGDIRTLDPLTPRVSAFAVKNGRVSALGRDQDIRAFAGPLTRIIDAGGRLVLPGFQDTHIHLQDSGTRHAFDVDLTDICQNASRAQLDQGAQLVFGCLRRA